MARPKKNENIFQYKQVQDIENNIYRSIEITNKTLESDQEWFADNLNVGTFRNGDIIFQAQSDTDWKKACENKIPAWCYFDEKKELGKIYNLYATTDARGLTPEGFELPNYIDFSILGLAIQELEPVDAIVHNSILERLEQFGITSGGMKMMAKDFWKKKGRDISGLSIIGGGYLSGGSLIGNRFEGFEKCCYLWLRPHGTRISIKDSSEKYLQKWWDFEILNTVFPEFNINTNDQIILSQEEYNYLTKTWKQSALSDKWNTFYANKYPIKKTVSKSMLVLSKYLFSPERNGHRIAVFESGKEQIRFEGTNDLFNGINYNGCYCRPFRYLNK
jgi:uncharacterized protein (TIGR02145 family)